jgi:hypothetical protein
MPNSVADAKCCPTARRWHDGGAQRQQFTGITLLLDSTSGEALRFLILPNRGDDTNPGILDLGAMLGSSRR